MHKKRAYMEVTNETSPHVGDRKDETMSKTATKTAEIAEFPAFDATQATDQIRAFAEKGVEQSKEAYARIRTGAEEAQKVLEATFEQARSAGNELSLKSLSALRANTEAGFAHAEALLGVKSVAEFFELQGAFLRQRFETMVEQAKDFQAASSKAAEEVAKPAKTAFEKSLKELKVA